MCSRTGRSRASTMTATWRVCAAVAVATLALVASVVRAQVPDPLPEPPYTPVHQAGYCVWYEECGESDDPRIPGKLNCVYNGPARNVRSTGPGPA